MLSILRTRAVALPGFSSTTRFLPIYTRALSSSTSRAFISSDISRQYGEGRRGGGNDRYDASSSPPRDYGSSPRPPRNPPSSTLFVGNLPFNVTPAQVQDLFAELGTVLSVRLGFAATGESKGFAHVDLADVATAQGIMQANAESQFFIDGRGILLDYAGPPAARPAFPPSNTLHFRNYSGDEESLQAAFQESASAITSLRINRNPQTGATAHYGFIEFKTQEDATAALEKFNGKEVAYGEVLALSYARGKNPASASGPPRYTDQGGDGYGFGAKGHSGGFNNRSRPAYGGRGGSGGGSY